MADLALQPSIATDLRSRTLLQLINRLKDPSLGGSLDLSPILVYRISSLVNSAVIPMAWQWDTLNSLLIPVASQLQPSIPTPTIYDQYRALIRLSTKLHSILGTPAALQQAFAGLGYPNAIIQEGQNSWGGNQYPANQGWAVFRVVIQLTSVPPGTNFNTLVPQAIAIANFWKPARCHLDSIIFQTQSTDTLIPAPTDLLTSVFSQNDLLSPAVIDFILASFSPITDPKTIIPLWNNRYFHTSVTYGSNEPSIAEGPLIVNGNAVIH